MAYVIHGRQNGNILLKHDDGRLEEVTQEELDALEGKKTKAVKPAENKQVAKPEETK